MNEGEKEAFYFADDDVCDHRDIEYGTYVRTYHIPTLYPYKKFRCGCGLTLTHRPISRQMIPHT